MDNEQLLLSIENMLDRMFDQKLEKHLEPIKKDIAELKLRVTRLEADMAELKLRVTKLEADVAELKDEVTGLDARMTRMEYKFDVLTREVTQLKDNVIDLTGRTANLEKSMQEQGERIKRIEIIHLENDLIPRVNNIESCYMSTFERYKDYNDRLPELFATVSNVSRTVQTHSEKLKKIS